MFTDINTKRFFTAVLSLLVFTYVFTMVVTPVVPGDLPWLLAGLPLSIPVVFGQLIVLSVITYIYSRNVEGRGIGEGVRFGTPMGLLLGLVFMGGMLSVVPLNLVGILSTLLIMLVYGIIGGIILSVTYPKA